MQTLASSASVLVPLGYEASSCGYCKDPNTRTRTLNSSANYYLVANRLHTDQYQHMIDRGMRRSGTVVYKPDVKRACCPHYTISLPAREFKPSKDQRQAVNRWNRFVLGEEYIKEAARRYPKSKTEKRKEQTTFDLLKAVHESEYSTLPQPPDPAYRFEVNLEPADFTEEKYQLFENYQRNVHREPPSSISRSGFKSFLCESPLVRTTQQVGPNGGVEQKLGSYHQCYRLDGRLIAIGVLDLLPQCVSGVYFIYHKDFEQYSFGKLSALREAALAIEGGYDFYYMGYYIHSCQKMRYKCDYKPQRIMDPDTLEWVPLDDSVKRLLDKKGYVSIQRELKVLELSAVDAELPSEDDAGGEFETVAQASSAAEDGVPLCMLGVPGVMTLEEVDERIGMANIDVLIGNDNKTVPAQILIDAGLANNPEAFKALVADIAACVGPVVARNMAIKLN